VGHVACGWRGKLHTGFWWEDLMENNHLKDLGINGNIIIKVDVQEMGWEGTDWNDLAQNRYRWRALMNTIMNFRFP
jgi:hypothetical protein